MTGLSQAERDFLLAHQGGVAGILAGDPGAVAQANAAAARLVGQIADRYPSRTERLLVLAAVARATEAARDDVLDVVLRGEFTWTNTDNRGWCGTAPDHYLVGHLAELAGLHPRTVQKRMKAALAVTLAEAQAAAGET